MKSQNQKLKDLIKRLQDIYNERGNINVVFTSYHLDVNGQVDAFINAPSAECNVCLDPKTEHSARQRVMLYFDTYFRTPDICICGKSTDRK